MAVKILLRREPEPETTVTVVCDPPHALRFCMDLEV